MSTLSQKFAPGNKSYAKRMIQYNAVYNSLNANSLNYNSDLKQCFCIPNKYNKLVVGSDSPSTRVSNNIRVAQIVNFSRGGKTQYGNFYLGQPLNLNYLGRGEGMPGGSGTAPKNKF
jgi:hypothetical protein